MEVERLKVDLRIFTKIGSGAPIGLDPGFRLGFWLGFGLKPIENMIIRVGNHVRWFVSTKNIPENILEASESLREAQGALETPNPTIFSISCHLSEWWFQQ